MISRKKTIQKLLTIGAILILILDSKTAIDAASEGIDLCIRCVIPSLFPFMVLTIPLSNMFFGEEISLMHSLLKPFQMPKQGESLFLVGLFGGYPTGAQAVTIAYKDGYLSKKTANRLLCFCSNAGPAFIFGIVNSLFERRYIPYILWIIHIVSALAVALVIPGYEEPVKPMEQTNTITVQQTLKKSIHAMAVICGWVILFRILITFAQKWFLFLLPQSTAAIIIGLLELTNGIFALHHIDSEAIRFILSSVFLGFGGICIMMQTASVTADLDIEWYLKGKVLQCLFSFVLSAFMVCIIYSADSITIVPISIAVIVTVFVIIFFFRSKKTVAFLRKPMYNEQK